MSRSFEPVQLGSIELFCKAAALGSFTAAAEALGITPAAVSRSVARLESRLGARLFTRSTRRIRLTAEGQAYHQHCQQALDQIAEAERAIAGRQQVPQGRLRVSVGTVYAQYRLMALLPGFQARYPQVALELHVANHNVDLVADGHDLAIRPGEPGDSALIARKLEDATLGVFGAPSYLSRCGRPQRLEDLARHDRLLFVRPSTGRPMPWLLRDDQGQDVDLNLDSPWQVHDDVQASLLWAAHGGGLVQTYHFAAATFGGALEEVLPQTAGRSRPFYVLYPHQRLLSARVRAFVDYLCRSVQEHQTSFQAGEGRSVGREGEGVLR
ncbi:LysR family transcriptional regulator [Ideonella livida]|uniref:LysR family transcriptional regulator n=1 Tax=Ideonella livida TaxID=2707176 RepID=UPI001940297F|nr:LysR family transcriptional regulator [Ideonella livida]